MLLDKEFSNVALISEKEKIFLHLRQQNLPLFLNNIVISLKHRTYSTFDGLDIMRMFKK